MSIADEAAELSIDAPGGPLRAHWPCDRLTSEPPRFELSDVETAMNLGHEPEVFNAPTSGTLEIRESPRDAPVAKLPCEYQVVYTYARSGGLVRSVIRVDGGWASGWIDAARLTRPARGAHRTRAPSVRMSVDVNGVRCDRDVEVLARVGDRAVHAATIHAGTRFDPNDAAEVFDTSSAAKCR